MNDLFEYKQELDALRFTPEQKTQLAAATVAAAQKQTRRVRRPIGRTVLAAACITAVLAVSAGASGVLKNAAEVFAPIFGGTAAQTEVIDKIGYPIGASATDNGVTISADAIMGDEYNAAIVFTFTRDDGTALLPEGVEAPMLLVGGTGGADLRVLGGSHGSSWFVDEDPTDDTLQMIQTVSTDVPLNDCTATAEFDGLYRWDAASGERIPVVEGRWKFKFDVAYEDSSVTLGGGETFAQDGLTFTIDKVRVSPVAVRVAYTADSEVQWSDVPSGRQSDADAREMQRYLENVEVLLTRTDGMVIDLSGTGGSMKPGHGTTVCVKGGVLDEIIPMEEIAGISVGGILYPISAE